MRHIITGRNQNEQEKNFNGGNLTCFDDGNDAAGTGTVNGNFFEQREGYVRADLF